MSSNLRDPIAIARGLGSAKDGTGHWWVQRLTAVALLLLAPWFAWFALGLVGADQQAVRAAIASPFNATLLLAFVLALSWHAQLGMQVIVEDYVHGWPEVALQIAIKFAYTLAALASILAIGRIVFTA
ncbi:MAG: succinate dehydrogenase, hydrophobic membrane anchor protein [Pseudoxanthomonas sp.]